MTIAGCLAILLDCICAGGCAIARRRWGYPPWATGVTMRWKSPSSRKAQG